MPKERFAAIARNPVTDDYEIVRKFKNYDDAAQFCIEMRHPDTTYEETSCRVIPKKLFKNYPEKIEG